MGGNSSYRHCLKRFQQDHAMVHELSFRGDYLAVFTGTDPRFGFEKANEVADLIATKCEIRLGGINGVERR